MSMKIVAWPTNVMRGCVPGAAAAGGATIASTRSIPVGVGAPAAEDGWGLADGSIVPRIAGA
jgi:hypothetical protein